MNDADIDKYVQELYKKYKEGKYGPAKILEEVREKLSSVRDIPIQFSIDEIHDLHMCISECIEYHKNNEQHPNDCSQCKNYYELYKRIVVLCDCVDKRDIE